MRKERKSAEAQFYRHKTQEINHKMKRVNCTINLANKLFRATEEREREREGGGGGHGKRGE